MAKDPAILWYYKDYLTGTEEMTFEEQGAYMRLLCKQADKGPLSMDLIKKTLKRSFEKLWPAISEKFKVDEDGNYFNERIALEVDKRKTYSSIQTENARKRWDKIGISNGNAMAMPLANANANGNIEEGKLENWNSKPKAKFPLNEIELQNSIQWIYRLKNQEVTIPVINGLWDAFAIHHFDGEKFYRSRTDCISHFRNWLKKQDIPKPSEVISTRTTETILERRHREQREEDELLHGKL